MRITLEVFIASRPEMHLTSAFNSRWINPILARLALDDKILPEDDIRRFLQDSFDEIRETHPFASLIRGPTWPCADTIERLVEKIIWAIYICFDRHEVHSFHKSPSDS